MSSNIKALSSDTKALAAAWASYDSRSSQESCEQHTDLELTNTESEIHAPM